MPKRRIEHTDHTMRWRAVIILTTGKRVEILSEWKQFHWEATRNDRTKILAEAKSRARHIRRDYGVGCERIQLWEERRMLQRVTEETTASKSESTHYLSEEESDGTQA